MTAESGPPAVPLRCAAMVLAAGGSSRLGRPKQLLRIGGKSLLRRAAESAIGSGASPVIVVLGPHADFLLLELEGLAITAVENPGWREGMGASLRCGIAALNREAPQVAAVMLMVCDQPRITATHLQRLWARYTATGRVIAVRYGNHPGVPAIFPAKYLPDLAVIQGDKGARSLLGSLSDAEVDLLAMPEAEFDVDTPEDFVRLVQDSQTSG